MLKTGRILLRVVKHVQLRNECAVAAASSLAKFHNSSIEYKDVRLLVSKRKRKSGLYASETASLLNDLGFKNVVICSMDMSMLDPSWSSLPREQIIIKLSEMIDHYRRQHEPYLERWVEDMRDWLARPDCDNHLIIDNDWSKHIKHQLNRGNPVCASLNWTSTFKHSKAAKGPGRPDINGEVEEHEVVIRGYDDKGVFIVDSHPYSSKGHYRKYSKGYYKLSWAKLLTNMPNCDLIWIN